MDLLYMFIGFIASLVCMFLLMPPFIRYLHKIKFGQTEREEGLASHKAKNGTPTMGGIAFILVPVVLCILSSFFTPYKIDMKLWKEVSREHHEADGPNDKPFDFVDLIRR